jgi:hypothetical protein
MSLTAAMAEAMQRRVVATSGVHAWQSTVDIAGDFSQSGEYPDWPTCREAIRPIVLGLVHKVDRPFDQLSWP